MRDLADFARATAELFTVLSFIAAVFMIAAGCGA